MKRRLLNWFVFVSIKVWCLDLFCLWRIRWGNDWISWNFVSRVMSLLCKNVQQHLQPVMMTTSNEYLSKVTSKGVEFIISSASTMIDTVVVNLSAVSIQVLFYWSFIQTRQKNQFIWGYEYILFDSNVFLLTHIYL